MSAAPEQVIARHGVVIAVDPHKASWTAVVVTADLAAAAAIRVQVNRAGYRQLRRFAAAWPDARWAIEGGWRPRFGVNDAGPGSWLVMLGDGSDGYWIGDGIGVGLGSELGWRVEQLVAQVGQDAGGARRHGHAAPAA